jgi:hypothetical protein
MAPAAFFYIFALKKSPHRCLPRVLAFLCDRAVLRPFPVWEPFGIKQIGGIALIMGVVLATRHEDASMNWSRIGYEAKDILDNAQSPGQAQPTGGSHWSLLDAWPRRW